jgi:hypothetical protein
MIPDFIIGLFMVLTFVALVLSAVALTTERNGNGSELTDLNASNLTTGTVDNARLSPNVVLSDTPTTFTSQFGFRSTELVVDSNNNVPWDVSSNQSATLTLVNNARLLVPTNAVSGFVYYLRVVAPVGAGLFMSNDLIENERVLQVSNGLLATNGNSLVQLASFGAQFAVTINNLNESILTLLPPATRLSTLNPLYYRPTSGKLLDWRDQGANEIPMLLTGTQTVTPNTFGSLTGIAFGDSANYVGNSTTPFSFFFGNEVNTTMFFVLKRDASSDCDVLNLISSGPEDFKVILTSDQVKVLDGGVTYTMGTSTEIGIGVPFVICVRWQPLVANVFINNTMYADVALSEYEEKSAVIGDFRLGAGLQGAMSEFIVYNRALSNADIFGILAELSAIYELPI